MSAGSMQSGLACQLICRNLANRTLFTHFTFQSALHFPLAGIIFPPSLLSSSFGLARKSWKKVNSLPTEEDFFAKSQEAAEVQCLSLATLNAFLASQRIKRKAREQFLLQETDCHLLERPEERERDNS